MKILWIPHTGWHIPQRAHLFCRALSARHEVHVTDWVADFQGPGDYFSSRYVKNFFYRQHRDGDVTVHGIPRFSPTLFSRRLRRLNTAIFTQQVHQIINRVGIDVVVGTFVLPPPDAPRVVFDLFDDNIDYWLSYGRNPAYAREIELVEEEYLARAYSIVAVSSVLRDKALRHPRFSEDPATRKKVLMIPNGVDLQKFRQGDGRKIRAALGLEQKMVIGFISALGEFSGLQKLVEAFAMLGQPDAVLLVVGEGPLRRPAQEWAARRGVKDIIFTGSIPSSQVHHYYAAIDIGVIPFEKTPFTDAACPIKLLEYLAAGKNVVSTNLEEVRRMAFPNVITVGDTANNLSEGIRHAAGLPPLLNEKINLYDQRLLVESYEAVLAGI